MKRAIVALLIAVLGFAVVGCDVAEEGGAGSSSQKKNKTAKPDIKVKATKILKEFEENEAAADGKYKGKKLQISGVVDKIDTELMDDGEYEVQIGGGSDFEIFTVNCDDQKSKAVAKLKKGQKITVIGDFEDGGDLGVDLKNCAIK